MTKFNVGNFVTIIRQPNNQVVNLVGQTGIIDNINGDYAVITAYTEYSNSFGGGGIIPLSCLEINHDEKLKLAYKKYKTNFRDVELELFEYTKKFNEYIEEIAKRFNLTSDDVKTICQLVENFERKNNPYER